MACLNNNNSNSNSSSSSAVLFLLCFLLTLSSATALNITEILRQHPEFSSFGGYLIKTRLADSLNGAQNITVLAVDNRAMSRISANSTEEVERLLRPHLVRGYYSARHLLQLSHTTASLPAVSGDGLVRVQSLESAGVGFTVAGEGSGVRAELVKPVFSHPKNNISVVQISDLLCFCKIQESRGSAR